MYRYLYKSNGTLSKFVRKQYKNYRLEEQGFNAALLAQTRNRIMNNIFEDDKKELQKDYSAIMSELYPSLNLMEIYEHWQLANNDHIEQIFGMLDSLKKASQGEDLILNRRYEELSSITALVDPDKFPIFSLLDVIDSNDIVSLWNYKPETLQLAGDKIGFTLSVKQSSLEHHEAGDGVFMNITQNSQFEEYGAVPLGTLVGLIPGAIFDSLQELEEYHGQHIREHDEYLHRVDDTVVDFGTKIFYPSNLANNMVDLKAIMLERQEESSNNNNSIHQVYGEMINPYGVGHKINHCKKDHSPNVIFQDIFVPIHFFTEQYQRFIPNLRAGKRPDSMISGKSKESLDFINNKYDYIRLVGVFAIRDIKDQEELFVNYFDANMFDVEDNRDWLVRPPPLSPYFTKIEYENEFTLIAKIIDSFLFKKFASVYHQFEQKVQHDPSRHEYEDQKQHEASQKQQESNYFNNKIKEANLKQQQKQKNDNSNEK